MAASAASHRPGARRAHPRHRASLFTRATTGVVIALGLLWLGVSRHRRAQRKHAGLRVLR